MDYQKKIFLSFKMRGFIIALFGMLWLTNAEGNVTITTATGGSMSADKAANATVPVYTTLGNIVLAEGASGDFSIGINVTLTFNAPAGYVFNASAAVTASAQNGRDISGVTV